MPLLEREPQFAALSDHLRETLLGRGRVVFVGGEAGAGKTTLVAGFAERAVGRVRVLRGACDGGAIPRPLGPLADVAPALGRVAGVLVEDPSRERLFRTTLAELAASPTALVIEDVHWADEATLDLIRFLGRRVGATPILVIATYRDDEVRGGHALTAVLGDLATEAGVARLAVPPLTRESVAQLAEGSGIDSRALHERTRGNPFYVTEMLAAGSTALPASIRDAVLARAARLSPDARRALEAAAVIGAGADASLVSEVSGLPMDALDECFERGLLQRTGPSVTFRHELAREAIEGDASAGALARMHAAALAALLGRGSRDDRRLAGHAAAAGDTSALLRHSPRAAARASALGAHREAAEHYRRAVGAGDDLSDRERAELLESLSYECYLTSAAEEALDTRRAALELRRALGDALEEGVGLRWLSRLSWFLGRRTDAARYALDAIVALEPFGASRELAMAYSNMAQLWMLRGATDEAVRWGTRAVELAVQLGEHEVLSHALNNVGAALLARDVNEGTSSLERSLDIALSVDAHAHAARAYANLGSGLVSSRRLERANEVLEAGIAYSADRDLDSWRLYMEAWLARSWLEQGQLARARERADVVLRASQAPPATRIVALLVAAGVAIRRGGRDVEVALREATRLAAGTGELQRLVPVACARAEAAWTTGDAARIPHEIGSTWDAVIGGDNAWDMGETAWWMYKGGAIARSPDQAAPPFAHMIDGDARDAATLWKNIGSPFWRAIALAETGNVEDAKIAVDLLRSMGADATVRAVARGLRSRGIRPPRGPRRETTEQPHGLTARELDVLGLLAEGRSNAEIADHLVLSEKTVGHHVSSILRKLNVPSRARAAAFFRGQPSVRPA